LVIFFDIASSNKTVASEELTYIESKMSDYVLIGLLVYVLHHHSAVKQYSKDFTQQWSMRFEVKISRFSLDFATCIVALRTRGGLG